MTTFAYTALEPSGKKKTGYIDAPSREAAIDLVTRDGRYVLEIAEQARRARTETDQRKRGKVSRNDLALFTRRMADLADAGLPLDRVLQVVAEQSESGALADVAEQALDDVRGGLPISDALAKHPKLFPDVYTQTLRAGEASGQFADVASRLADFQEKEVARRSQIVSALIYPSVLALTAFAVVTFLLTFVVPRLSGIFKDLGNDLPLATQILLAVTGFITNNTILLLAGLVGSFLLYRAWASTEAGGLTRDRLLVKIPLLGPVILKATVSRFARVLGTLVYGGVPILDALRLAGLSSGNRVFRRSADLVEDEVREGRPIAESMRDSGSFPPVLTHMVAIGEQTGDLPKMLGRVSDSLDFEVDNGMRRLTALVEPVIVLVMGAFVGFVVLAVLLPIFQAQELVK
ncbi:MAG TPA: type II secretion system F family protein [Fimbriimonadaceae bacterium]|nr:type II secretion system F family protein [Fimbriimonadaceae bacterium]HRJ97818.1 type II secretion system F family protein [Fimbriimonadaceae bacterium]